MKNACRPIVASTALLFLSFIQMPCATEAAPPEAALAKEVSIDFKEVRLDDVVAFLSRRYRIPFVVDQQSIGDMGMRLDDIVVSHSDKNTPLNRALDKMLKTYKLAWFERDGSIVLTSAKAAEEEYFETRVYKITRDVPVDRRMRTITWNVAPDSWATVGGRADAAPLPPDLLIVYQSPLKHREIARKFSKSLVPVRARKTAKTIHLNAQANDNKDSTKLVHHIYDTKGIVSDGGLKLLTEAIEYTIAPSEWEAVGGSGRIQPGKKPNTLEVLQSHPVHRQLRRLLEDLRAAKGTD